MKHLLLLCLGFMCLSTVAQDTVKVKTVLTPEQEADLAYNDGLELITKKDYSTAVSQFSKAISFKPNFERAFYNRAVARHELRQFEESIQDYNHTLLVNPTNMEALFGKAENFYQLKKKDSCLTFIHKTIQRDSLFSKAFYLLGQLKFDEAEYKEAILHYNKAISTKADYAYAYNDRASAKKLLGDDSGAIQDYEKAIALDPKLFFAYNNLGSCKRNKGDHAGAVEAYTKAIDLKPDYFIALNNRGTVKLNTGDYLGAMLDFEEALRQKSNYPLALNNLASVFIKKQDFKSALDWSNKALNADVNLGAAYLNRGIAKQMLRDEEGACVDWKKASELGIPEGKRYHSSYCN